MAQARVVIGATKPNKRVELDTVDLSPANQVLLLPEPSGGGPVVPFYVQAPSNNWTIAFLSNSPFSGASGAVSDLPANLLRLSNQNNDCSGITGTVAQFGSSMQLIDFQGNTTTNTALSGTFADLTSTSYTWLAFEKFSNLTGTVNSLSVMTGFQGLILADNGNITGSVSNLPSSTMLVNITNQTGITGSLSVLPSSLTTLILENVATTWGGSISDLPSGMITLQITGAGTGMSGSINSLPSTLRILYLNNVSTGNNLTGSLNGTLPGNLDRLQIAGTGSGMTGGDIANLSSCRAVELTGFSCSYSYTAGTTWSGTNLYQFKILPAATYCLTTTQVDNILIDLANADWQSGGTIDLSGNNSVRSSASNAAVSALTGMGVGVTTN